MKHKCDGCRHKGEHREMGFAPFGICGREYDLVSAEQAYNAQKCPYGMGDGELGKAIQRLEIEYEKAKRLDFVVNPLAYALYQVWKMADRKKG